MSVIILFISGDMFLFEDNGITQEQIQRVQQLADTRFNTFPKLRYQEEVEICSWFENEIKLLLGITLKRVEVSYVIRINK